MRRKSLLSRGPGRTADAHWIIKEDNASQSFVRIWKSDRIYIYNEKRTWGLVVAKKKYCQRCYDTRVSEKERKGARITSADKCDGGIHRVG